MSRAASLAGERIEFHKAMKQVHVRLAIHVSAPSPSSLGVWLELRISLIGEEGEGDFRMLGEMARGGALRAVRGCQFYDQPQDGTAQQGEVLRGPGAPLRGPVFNPSLAVAPPRENVVSVQNLTIVKRPRCGHQRGRRQRIIVSPFLTHSGQRLTIALWKDRARSCPATCVTK